MICSNDFHQYLSGRIRDGDLLPWIPCPAESCSIPCDVQNIVEDGQLTRDELLMFISKFMMKKLSRNENFISCSNCSEGGFIRFGEPKRETVSCKICNATQTIERGVFGELDPGFSREEFLLFIDQENCFLFRF